MDFKKIAFLSDFHLGVDGANTSKEREAKLVKWCKEVGQTCDEIFWLGDLFDFYFEYHSVIPTGFSRFHGALANLADQGIKMHYFIGNHDMWVFDYFQQEYNMEMHRDPVTIIRQNKTLLVGHGDGLGPGDHSYKWIKKVFRHPISIFLFQWIHPDIGIGIANKWSNASRNSHGDIYKFHGLEREYLLQYCEQQIAIGNEPDFFIFGHRHQLFDYKLSNSKSRYVNTGDWLRFCSYAILEHGDVNLCCYEEEQCAIITNEY